MKNKYYISKHRFYELKHYCLQYKEWEELYKRAESGYIPSALRTLWTPQDLMKYCKTNMRLIEQSAAEADQELSGYILQAVTQDLSFNYLKEKLEMPCEKDKYYDRHHKFFWILNNRKLTQK